MTATIIDLSAERAARCPRQKVRPTTVSAPNLGSLYADWWRATLALWGLPPSQAGRD